MADLNDHVWRLRRDVLKGIREDALFGTGDTVIVAVSGGADSVALLDILASFADLRPTLIVAHLNHSLRASESDAEETFVRDLAVRYHLACEVGRADVKALGIREKISLEQAGRVARYAFLNEVAARHGAHAIAVAHHSDDQAETVLMRLLRGTGATGLAGMAPKTKLNVVRPLLRVTRDEILTYLAAARISYCCDSSNTDTTFLRNRIRHELLPCLATYNPSILERLAATAETLAADEFLLDEMTTAAFSRHGKGGEELVILSVPGVASESKGLRLRLYRRAILMAKRDLDTINFLHLGAIDRLLLSSRPNASLDLPQGIHVRRAYTAISFAMSPEPALEGRKEITVEGPGSYDLPIRGRLTIEEASPPRAYAQIPPTIAFFDADAAPFPWLIRNFMPGDRIVPLGMPGHKKVKEIFIDSKIPSTHRRRFPLLFSRERLIWVCSLRVSNETRVTERTERVLRVEISDLIT